jgi:hypothetical protein
MEASNLKNGASLYKTLIKLPHIMIETTFIAFLQNNTLFLLSYTSSKTIMHIKPDLNWTKAQTI